MRKYAAAALISLSALVTAYATYYVAEAISNGTFCAMDLPIPLYLPLFYALGVTAGLLIHELFRSPASADVDLDAVARFFDKEEEWFIVREILTKGSVLQSDVSDHFGKVKTSRAVAALEAKDLVRRERVGKTYVILAGPALKDLLR